MNRIQSTATDERWQKENSVAEFIPYAAQVSENTVKTLSGDYIQVIQLDGLAHESADPENVVSWKDQLNALLKNISSPQICVWSTTVRREENQYPGGSFQDSFDGELNEQYRGSVLNKNKLMVNELYLSIMYRPAANAALGLFAKMEKNSDVIRRQQQEAIEKLNEVVSIVISSLNSYGPRVLGTYVRNSVLHSEIIEFFDFLVNGTWTPRALPKKVLADCIARSRPFFGADAFELRGVVETKVGAILGISEYPEGTEPGLLNALLSAPFPLVLTQSFNFISRPVALKMLEKAQRRMETTEDLAVSQVAEISLALDELASGRIVFGEHHLSLTIFADNPHELKGNIGAAHAELSACSMVVAREDWALASAFWAQLPGNTKYRPRPAPISSRNFAGFSSFHNYSTGRRTGNQWGPAVTMFKTSSGAPYYFNFHAALAPAKAKKKAEIEAEYGADALTEDKEEQKALGNTLIIGPSDSGKTVVQGFLLSQSKKFKPTQIIFDKDRGLEIFVRAGGGVYLPLSMGAPTGFNPFQMEPTADNLLFLDDLVGKLCGGELTERQNKKISDAVRGVMEIPNKRLRRIGRCMDFLDPAEENGPYDRLSKWCSSMGGPLAWVLDNDEDLLDFDNNKMFGFDMTKLLDHAEIRTPVVMYLFHRIESLLDGRRLQICMDEFWKLLLDSYFEEFAQNKQKVIRKQNGIMIYGTQNPKDVINSPIAHTLINECSTMIFMPNPKADHDHYVGNLQLTEREYTIIKEELTPKTGRFLIKQGHSSVVAELDLRGFDDKLAVISGSADSVLLVESIIKEYGDDPAVWLPIYRNKRG